MHILWRIHAALPAQFITMNLIQMWRRTLVNVLCFPPRPLTRLELGPTASWWPAERPRPCLMPSPPCPCWRTSTWLPASPHPPCALCWAGKSPAIMGLRSHPTTSTWEMSASPWATWPATSSRACCPRPRTGECWARASHSSASLRRCSWHGGGLKMPTSNPNNQPRGHRNLQPFLDGTASSGSNIVFSRLFSSFLLSSCYLWPLLLFELLC